MTTQPELYQRTCENCGAAAPDVLLVPAPLSYDGSLAPYCPGCLASMVRKWFEDGSEAHRQFVFYVAHDWNCALGLEAGWKVADMDRDVAAGLRRCPRNLT